MHKQPLETVCEGPRRPSHQAIGSVVALATLVLLTISGIPGCSGEGNSDQIARAEESAQLLDEAALLQDRERLDEAIARLTQAIEVDPESGVARYRRALLTWDDDEENARDDLEAAFEIQPTLRLQWLIHRQERAQQLDAQATAAQLAQEFEEAIALYQEALTWTPDNPQLLTSLASAEASLGRYGESADLLQTVLDRMEGRPQDQLTVLSFLAGMQVLAERYDEALDNYDSALELDPGNPDLHSNRGTLRLILRRFDDALEDFEITLQSDPDDPLALLRRAQTLDLLDRPEDAQAARDRAEQAQPGIIRMIPPVQLLPEPTVTP